MNDFIINYLEEKIVSVGFTIDGMEVYSAETIRKVLFSGIDNKPNFERVCT